jgi:hypothetical protein
MLVGSIYRPPSGEMNSFLTQLLAILDKSHKSMNQKFVSTLLAGDFNIDLLKISSSKPIQDFIDHLATHFLIPCINKATRISGSAATLIDNIFMNSSNAVVKSAIVFNDLSDHYPIIVKFKFGNNNLPKTSLRKFRKYDKKSVSNFLCSLRAINWADLFQPELVENNADLMHSKFVSMYKHVYDNSFPLTNTVTSSQNKKLQPRSEWITESLIKCCNIKSKLYKIYRKNRTIANELKYKVYRNKLKSLLLTQERKYYQEKLTRCTNDSKLTWKVVNKLIRNSDGCGIDFKFNVGGTMETDPLLIVNKFNDFFSTIGANLSAQIPHTQQSYTSYLKGTYPNSFILFPTDFHEIVSVVNNLPNKKSAGMDEITMDIMKRSINIIADPLSKIINASFETGVFPNELKVGKVCPIHKDGPKNEFENYRPISILQSFSKIFEKLVYMRLERYLRQNQVLNPAQYGFRENRSTTMALLDFYDKISTAIDDKKYSIGIFIDLRKAFDTIDHKILLGKIQFYGIRGLAFEWFKNYLTNRIQYVCINDTYSNSNTITCGVPQGSILGPLLFLIYINDIVESSSILHFMLFADDTNLSYSDNCINNLKVIVNSEIAKLSTWFTVNKLSFNCKKSNYMLFGHKHLDDALCKNMITINSNTLERVKVVKFLGILIDDKMDWKAHISHVASKVARNIGIMYKIKNKLNLSTMIMLYNSLVYSHLLYCCIVWGSASSTSLNKLRVLQKKIIRIITGSPYRAHSNVIFSKLCILKFDDIYVTQIVTLMFKIYNRFLPPEMIEFYSMFQLRNYCSVYNTRKPKTDFLIPFARTNLGRKNFACEGPRLWNGIPESIRDLTSLCCFKKEL